MRKRPLQTKSDVLLVGGRQLLGCGHQRVGEGNTCGKASDAGDDVACQHELLVVKAQPVPQSQGPGQPILLDLMPLDHLRLRRPARIDTVEGVEDQIRVSAHRAGAADHRVEHTEVFGRDKDQLVWSLSAALRV